MNPEWIYVPEEMIDRLKQLKDSNIMEGYIKNAKIFYKLKHDGKFLGYDDKYVLIENEVLVGFYDSLSALEDLQLDTNESSYFDRVDQNEEVITKFNRRSAGIRSFERD